MTVYGHLGNTRKEAVRAVLSPHKEWIEGVFKKVKTAVVKPNLVSPVKHLACTHKDTLEETVRFISDCGAADILVVEGSGEGPTKKAFYNMGYLSLKKDYPISFIDIEDTKFEDYPVFREFYQASTVPLSTLITKAPFLVSLAPAKTHDTVMVTLSLKNTAYAGIPRREKYKLHTDYPIFNFTLAALCLYTEPDLSLVDGFIGMENNGPCDGTPVRWGTVFSGREPLEVDKTVSNLMGFPPDQIGYLFYLTKIKTLLSKEKKGLNENAVLHQLGKKPISPRKFAPHHNIEMQKKWALPKEEEGILISKIKEWAEKHRRKKP